MTLGWPMQSQRKPKSGVDVAFPTKSGWLLATCNSRQEAHAGTELCCAIGLATCAWSFDGLGALRLTFTA